MQKRNVKDANGNAIAALQASVVLSEEQIEKAEEFYKATYVCDSSIKDKHGNWYNHPVAIFWQENPPSNFSNYFGLYFTSFDQHLMIVDGASAASEPFTAILTPEGELLYSVYRWHMLHDSTGKYAVDGGRDYLKISGEHAKVLQLQMQILGKEVVAFEVQSSKLGMP